MSKKVKGYLLILCGISAVLFYFYRASGYDFYRMIEGLAVVSGVLLFSVAVGYVTAAGVKLIMDKS